MQNITTSSLIDTQALGEAVGRALKGGEVLELISDVGGGKTTFIKGLARGLGIGDVVQSPTFTISRQYSGRDGLELHHFDFYRLQEAGVVAEALADSLSHPDVVVAVEWGELVHDVLPPSRLTLTITSLGEEIRRLEFAALDDYQHVRQTVADYKSAWNLA